jgi:alpha-L-fucosidase
VKGWNRTPFALKKARMNPFIFRNAIPAAAVVVATSLACAQPIPTTSIPTVIVNTTNEPVAAGAFSPTWKSLKNYQTPEWFRDAKFGIWACFGPQCQAEDGDWYGRGMYDSSSAQNKFHVAKYGPPAKFGFKDLIHEWHAEKWDPGKLLALYKRAGAQYFVAMANHHDNFDCWNSKYQPWNSASVGPKKDLIAGWAKAARDNGLRFGVSVHASHAWTWFELARNYDGQLTSADGQGLWWDGLDPQDLYAQNHAPSQNDVKTWDVTPLWNWGNGASIPDQGYCDKFYNRTMDLINQFHPDLIYFDDTALPLWPVSDAGLKIAAHFYNRKQQWHGDDGVLLGKILDPDQRWCMVWDIERGTSNEIEPRPWQTDTCIGDWHYQRSLYDHNGYKSAKTVIQMLADIVSKNGNLLLNIPVRGSGTIDEKEEKILNDIAAWMAVNQESIFGTRPWRVFGEGPATNGANLSAQGFNEGKGKPFTVHDIRFTTKGTAIYAIVLGWPTNGVGLQSFGKSGKWLDQPIQKVELLGSGEKIKWMQTPDALMISQPKSQPSDIAIVFKITLET